MMNPEKSYRRRCPRETTAVAVPEQGVAALDNRGFTLVEILVVCVLLGVLVTLAIPSYTAMINTAKVARCAEEIRTLEKDISAYQADRGTLPPDLTAVGQGTLLDPWKHQYEYHTIANIINSGENGGVQYEGPFIILNTDYDLYSKGADNLSTYAIPFPADTHTTSSDDIVRGSNGAFVGLAARF